MKQLFFDGKGQLHIEDVPAPACGPGEVLAQTAYSLISAGTESTQAAGGGSLVRRVMKQPQLIRSAAQFALKQGVGAMLRTVQQVADEWTLVGYSAAGTVVEVGAGVTRFAVGDRVACAGAGHANHAEFVAVPENLAVKIPGDLPFREAAFVTLGAIALQGVRRAEPTLGETVAVVGSGLIGLLAAQLLRANGCTVIATDLSDERLTLARTLGVDHTINVRATDPAKTVMALTDGLGADAVILCAAAKSSEPVNQAFKMCRERGRVVIVGAVGMELERPDFYNKEIDLRMSRSYGPGRYDRRFEEQGYDYPPPYVRWTETRNLSAFLEAVAAKRVNVAALISSEYPIEEAQAAYDDVLKGGPSKIGVLLKYPEHPFESVSRTHHLKPSATRSGYRPSAISIALVGAGSFAKAMHAPNLKALGARVPVVVSGSGVSARQVAELLNAEKATTDFDSVLADSAVNAVLISTRHNLHAAQVIAAARAGKHIFVEKPLGLTGDECRAAIEAVEAAGVLCTVGFNRRFSPFAVAARDALKSVAGPKQIACRVNAGPLPKSHWLLDPNEGGGRLIGEGCHFFDLMAWLAGSAPESATAQRIGDSVDDVSAVVRFADGSVGTLIYTGLGDPQYPKERIEIFAGGGVVVIDDFRAVEFSGLPGKSAKGSQNKGHRELLANFVAACEGKATLGVTAHDGLLATLCTEAALEAMKSGRVQEI
jgi:predicted dehydrogenase/D-arabinose 1-dehydrogenase-like Zn-dependent alcohol dehydrogenase